MQKAAYPPKRNIPPIVRYDRPQSVRDVQVGHLVIAFESDDLGWWEAIVLEKQGEKLTLAWHGCDDQPEFARSTNQIALMCPGKEASAA